MRPAWLDDFSVRFGLYDKKAVPMVDGMKDPTEDFRERAVELLRDLARQEREVHRSRFDMMSRVRADAFDRAADFVASLARRGK